MPDEGKVFRLSEMSREELNQLKDEEVRPYIDQWLEYVDKVLDQASKAKNPKVAMAKVVNTLSAEKKELLYVIMFTIKPEYRPRIVKLFDALAKFD